MKKFLEKNEKLGSASGLPDLHTKNLGIYWKVLK
jgi:hypothetical protein